jgi:CubicO group peptidase (beta-lactamase class C family)
MNLTKLTSRLAALWLAAAMPAMAQSIPPALQKPELILGKAVVAKSAKPKPLASAPVSLDAVSYEWEGAPRKLADFIADGKVKAFLVLKDGKIVHEWYKWPTTASTKNQSWSMMKQMLSVLVGIAVQEGRIRSIDDPMDQYEPRLAANGFAGVTFKQALLMASGIKYNEEVDRVKLFSDIIIDKLFAGAGGADLVEKTVDPILSREAEPGSRYQYASITSQAISLALEAATHQTVASYLQTRLWQPLGMVDDAQLLVDRKNEGFTFCCLYATARSYAAFGQLMAQDGAWNGRQIVDADWVKRSTTFADPASWSPTQVVRNGETLNLHGFAYAWWPLVGERGDFQALGVYGQGIHVLPQQHTVVVRLSDDFNTPGSHAEEFALLSRAIADHLTRP